MKIKRNFTAIIEQEDNMYVALCPELDVASQGNSVEEARKNLKEAIELFLESATPSEIQERRLHSEPSGNKNGNAAIDYSPIKTF